MKGDIITGRVLTWTRHALLCAGLVVALLLSRPVWAAIPDLTPQAESLIADIKVRAGAEAAQTAQDVASTLARDVVLAAPEAAVARAPGSTAALSDYALWLYRNGRLDDAAAISWYVSTLAETARGKSGALTLMAEARIAQGRTRDGVTIYTRALELDGSNERIQRRLASLQEKFDFRIQELSLDAERDSPTACATFTAQLRRPLPIKPQDYVRVTPAADLFVYAAGNRLCVKGLLHGKNYKITYLRGIPSAGGAATASDDVRDVKVGDRTARVQFAANRFILPRTGKNLLPIKTVNVSRVNLRVLGVGERALIELLRNDTLGKAVSGYTADDLAGAQAREIWQGYVQPKSLLNREVTTLLSMDKMIGKKPVGVYAVIASTPAKSASGDDGESEERWRDLATQWVIVSDIGLSAFKGSDGLTLFARSLESAKPMGNVSLQLIARDNDILGEVVSNADGKARFAPGLLRGTGGASASHIIARTRGGDFNLLRLDGAALDLSERGVEGVAAIRTALDAFLYTERGIYRPGETVRVSALLRTARMAAQPKLPLLFGVYRPDGSEFYKVRMTGDALGSYDVPIAIPAGARSGNWEVRAYLDPKQESLGTVRFRVEDFVPQRIELIAKPAKPVIDKGEVFAANASAKFYYGPPAADLPVEVAGDVVADDAPFEKFASYQFGRVEENFESVAIAPLRLATDAAGRADLRVDLGDIPDTTRPLKARLGVTLFDVSGRPIYTQVTARVRTTSTYIGVKPAFTGYVGENQDAPFDVVAVNDAGRPLAGKALEIAWIREDYDYSWYVENGNWSSRTTVTDITVGNNMVRTDSAGRAKIAHAFPGGRYRVEVRDAGGDAIASYRFDAGWWSSGETSNAPDALELNLKTADVSSGDNLSAFVKAPFDGEALVAVVSSDVVYTTTAAVSKAGTTVSVPVKAEWGAGAYLMVSAYRPKLGSPSPLPARAMGLAWFGIDKARRQLPVTFRVPAETLPRQAIELPISIKGASGDIGMTIAAVDEGVLALTRFKSPKPEDHYLGQRQLGLDVYDHYGSLIQPAAGAEGNLHTGGDAAMENATGNTTRSTKVIALFTRQVSLDGSGNGKVTLNLPDFNGRLRLMAVAWSDTAVGSGEANLVVRDPVVTDVILPRFIAAGDAAQATLSLHNVSGKTQTVAVTLSGNNGLTLASGLKGSVTLKNNERRDIPVTIQSGRAGDAKAFLSATIGGRKIFRDWDIAVRPASTITTQRAVQLLQAGQSLTLGNSLLKGFIAGTTKANVTVTNRPDYDVPGLLDYLDQYPYGCTEQTTSSALPLLYFADVAAAYGRDGKATDMKQRVDIAILKLLERQTDNGGLGFWNSADSVDPWTSAYAFDFLTRAKQKGHFVPPLAYDNLRRFLANHINASGENDKGVGRVSYYYRLEGRVYALYALARAGFMGASDVRYFAENEAGSLSTRLAKSQLAGALAAVGETKRATAMFADAARTRRPAISWWDYGSDTRDAAASLVILAESKNDPAQVLQIAEALDRSVQKRSYYWSTQEAAWLLIAAHHVTSLSGGDMNLVAGAANYMGKKPFRMKLDGKSLASGFVLKNNGTGPLRVITSTRGAPVKIQAPSANGFSISRRVVSMSGAPLAGAALKQNARVVVVIEGVKVDGAIGETLVTDLLPAGLEIESILGGAAASGSDETAGSNMAWLGRLTPMRFSDARDDRFVAAMDLNYAAGESFRVAYIARAITPGAYVHPGVYIEDMYQPQYIARGAASRLTVVR